MTTFVSSENLFIGIDPQKSFVDLQGKRTATTQDRSQSPLVEATHKKATALFSLPTSLTDRLKREKRPLKVEILECSGGQGHKKCAGVVQNVIKSHLKGEEVAVEFTRKDVGSYMVPDPLGKVTLGKYTVIDLHNSLTRQGKTDIIKVLIKIGKFVHKFYFPFNVKYFNECYHQGEAPDLIISAVPLVNGPLLTSVKNKGIPILVVTTDADNTLFSANWPKDKNLSPHRYCIPYNSLEIAQKINRAVDPAKIRGVGYPVRSEFLKMYSPKELDRFRQELGIDAGRKLVGVMMGGLGGVVTQKYLKQLLQSIKKGTLQHTDTHFTFFCGTNEAMQSTLIKEMEKAGFTQDPNFRGEGTKLVHGSGVSTSVVGFTKNVHKHMALSNCWVTKPGSSSFNECLSMAVPMLIDNTSEPLPWEKLNIDLAETYTFGESVTKFSRFTKQLNKILEPKNYDKYHQAMIDYRNDRPAQKNFGTNVVKLTYELLKEAEEDKQAKLLEKTGKKKMTALEWIKNAGRKVAAEAWKACQVALKCIFSPLLIIGLGLKKTAEAIVDYSFFSGFGMKHSAKVKRRRELIRGIRHTKQGETKEIPHKGKPIEGAKSPLASTMSKRPIDALYIQSNAENRTGNAIIYVLGKEYQKFNPKNYDHLLNDGADIVLFNPSANSSKTMNADLKTVFKELRRKNPDQKLLLHGYCIGAHVAASAAADIAADQAEGLKKESIPVIVDRGYGDGYEIAKKITSVAKVPYVRKYINRHCNNNTLAKIEKHGGAMLFLSPTDGSDQLNHEKLKGKKFRNFTKSLRDKHTNGTHKLIELRNADHWTPWTFDVHNQVKQFLSEQNIIQTGYKKFDAQNTGGFPETVKVPWARQHVLPLFI